MNVVKEGFLDGERTGIGGFASTSRDAMIGSVLLVGMAGSGGIGRLVLSDVEAMCSIALPDVTADAGLPDGESLDAGPCGVIGPDGLVGIGGSAPFGGLEGSGVVSRRIGSTLLADIARSTRGEGGSASLDKRLCLDAAGLTCNLESCCPDCDRDDECRECCWDDDRVLVVGAVGSGFSGDLGGVIEWLELLGWGSTVYLLPWTDRTGTYFGVSGFLDCSATTWTYQVLSTRSACPSLHFCDDSS